MGNFIDNLKLSEISEKRLIKLLESRGATEIERNRTNSHDIKYSIESDIWLLEAKEDRKYSETGHVAFEILSRKKPSGLSVSKADLWCYVLGNLAYFCEAPKLKHHFIRRSNGRPVMGGDNKTSELILIPLTEFKELFDEPLTLPPL